MAGVLSKKPRNNDLEVLPDVNESMALQFLRDSSNIKVADIKAKAYYEQGDITVVGNVSVKRIDTKCILKALVFTKQKDLQNHCIVVMTVNENKHVVENLRCITCAHGGCEHSLVLLRYLQKNSEGETRKLSSPLQQVTSNKVGFINSMQEQNNRYSKKNLDQSAMTLVKTKMNGTSVMKKTTGNNKESVKSNKQVKDAFTVLKENQWKLSQAKGKKNAIVTKTLSTKKIEQNLGSIIYQYPTENKTKSAIARKDLLDLSLNSIALQCSLKGIHTAEGFLAFAKIKMTENLCLLAEQETRQQSKSTLWHSLRYGRITASKIHETSRCMTENGRLVQEILGLAKHFENSFTKRGKDLEDEVFDELLRQGHSIRKCGFYLSESYPFLGASPDGIGNDFIVEIKCPSSHKTFQNYRKDGQITNKCKAQVQLQMLLTNKKKALFCVADPNFEYNRKIYLNWVEYDPEEMTSLIVKVSTFWKRVIYPKLG